ncbi:MAG: hypothetical protein AAFY76_21905, partial [Cyanobacteria bacterium J06649_11]
CGKYFLHQPIPYYWDVIIDPERLKHLPEKQCMLEGLPIISTENGLNEVEKDLGPGPKLFNTFTG